MLGPMRRCGEHGRYRSAIQNTAANWPRLAEADRGWPRLEAALSILRRWRGVSKLEGEVADASGRLLSTEAGAHGALR